MVIADNNKLITNTSNLKFLGIIDNALSWKGQINKIVPRLSQACYITRADKLILSQEVLQMIYYACFNSVMTYGLLFWGNSSHCIEIFRLHKKKLEL
jgi:hypothetical protein